MADTPQRRQLYSRSLQGSSAQIPYMSRSLSARAVPVLERVRKVFVELKGLCTTTF